MHHPIVPLKLYEKSLQKVHDGRVGVLPTLPARKTKCPLHKTHLKLRMLPSDQTPQDNRYVKYEGLNATLDINSNLNTGLEDYAKWSKKMWRKKVLNSSYVRSENLRPEDLTHKLLNIDCESLDLTKCLVGFHLSNLIYGSIHFNKNLKESNLSLFFSFIIVSNVYL